MTTALEKIQEMSLWKAMEAGQCAYRTCSPAGEYNCKHLYALSSDICNYYNCPIVQSRYISFQRQDKSVFMIEKIPGKPLKDTWVESELEGDFRSNEKSITKKLASFPEEIRNPALRKAKTVFSIVEKFKSALESEIEEEEEEGEED